MRGSKISGGNKWRSEWEKLYKKIGTWVEKLNVIWDDRVSDVKLRCVGKIVRLIWKCYRCYVESEPLKSNTSKENLRSKNLI